MGRGSILCQRILMKTQWQKTYGTLLSKAVSMQKLDQNDRRKLVLGAICSSCLFLLFFTAFDVLLKCIPLPFLRPCDPSITPYRTWTRKCMSPRSRLRRKWRNATWSPEIRFQGVRVLAFVIGSVANSSSSRLVDWVCSNSWFDLDRRIDWWL